MILLSYRLQLLSLQQCRQHLTNKEWQYAQTLSQKRQLQFCNGRALTRQLLQQHFCYSVASVAIELPSDKAPALTVCHQPWHLSISHSGQVVAVAVSKKSRLGLDVEKIKSRNIAEFSAEYAALTNADNLTAFYRCWTAAEAYSKYSAEPLLSVLQQPLAKEVQYKHLLLSGYMLCLCSKQNNVQYLIYEDNI
ncbi:4'-phosphopantetheinyl transferase family protein [Rheinheimera salexigens]|uniref:Uncharacterized protein n=1 Tax=Rheinheimera salexigens TaxID=1628148 RepID=A0A1E7Q2T1_9GAMM|nr:hypothetical protein [Rheinheimera salexigens]OEY68436.1 hypothetical protein BI198_01780 [Rheinheimera salexigens]